MLDKIRFEVKGVVPTILHNGVLADPTNPIAREMKKITNKGQKKSDKDNQLLSELEWLGALYVDAPLNFEFKDKGQRRLSVTCEGSPCWPGENIEAGVCQAAKNAKKGQDFKAGFQCEGTCKLILPGNPTVEKCFYDDRYFDYRLVIVNRSRIMRTRPIFRDWGLSFIVTYDDEFINKKHVIDAVTHLGKKIGLSDYRPKYGRFEIVEIS